MSLRADLVEYLTTILPTIEGLEKVRVIGSVRNVGEGTNTPMLIVKTNGLRKLPQAPRTHMTGEFSLTLVSPHVDIDAAEDQLDGLLELLLPALFTWGMSWESADQVDWDESRIAYDITINSIYKKE